MRLTVHTEDEFPKHNGLLVVPTNGSYAVLNDRYANLSELEEVIGTLPITRGAVIRGSINEGYRIEHAPSGSGPYRQIAKIELL